MKNKNEGLSPSLEKEMAIHSSILAWRIPWTEECSWQQPMGSQRIGHDWATNADTQPLLIPNTISREVTNLLKILFTGVYLFLFFFFFLMEYIWFTLLSVSGIQQSESVYTYIHFKKIFFCLASLKRCNSLNERKEWGFCLMSEWRFMQSRFRSSFRGRHSLPSNSAAHLAPGDCE